MLRIDELDVRASAGGGLADGGSSTVAEWQLPSEIVRSYTTAPAAELRIITVLGDSMEPTLMPAQRVLVDTGDRRPSPPGIFVVWDGLGLVVKRVQLLQQTDPPRVKITSTIKLRAFYDGRATRHTYKAAASGNGVGYRAFAGEVRGGSPQTIQPKQRTWDVTNTSSRITS
jgi:hypothetical protein